jgi:hypothetical protein
LSSFFFKLHQFISSNMAGPPRRPKSRPQTCKDANMAFLITTRQRGSPPHAGPTSNPRSHPESFSGSASMQTRAARFALGTRSPNKPKARGERRRCHVCVDGLPRDEAREHGARAGRANDKGVPHSDRHYTSALTTMLPAARVACGAAMRIRRRLARVHAQPPSSASSPAQSPSSTPSMASSPRS